MMKVEVKAFGEYKGQSYSEIFITNDNGTQISFSDLGARVNRWGIEKEAGTYEQIILGHQNAEEVITSGTFYGATIGRIAGRITAGKFELDGKQYQLGLNNNGTHLHGGFSGFDVQKFDYKIELSKDEARIIFQFTDPAGHNDYPGELKLKVTHTYNNNNEWCTDYEAMTDAPTLFNPTNHVYFNLNGDNRESILNHQLWVDSSTYLPLLPNMSPVGPIASVDNTVFDLRDTADLGAVLTSTEEPQFDFTKGFDHPFILDKTQAVQAKIICLENKRVIEMETTEVAVVIYTHGYLNNIAEIWSHPLKPFAGITLETQNLPDAINHGWKGDTILRPGEIFTSQTLYRLRNES